MADTLRVNVSTIGAERGRYMHRNSDWTERKATVQT